MLKYKKERLPSPQICNGLRWLKLLRGKENQKKKDCNNRWKILMDNFEHVSRKRKPLECWYPLAVVMSRLHCLKPAVNKQYTLNVGKTSIVDTWTGAGCELIDFLGFNLFVFIWNRIRQHIKYGNIATFFLFILHCTFS